jgi:uncharacterized protein DUF4136
MIELRSVFWVIIPGCFLLTLLSGCAGPEIKTGNGVAPGADFSRRITFQFLPDHGAGSDPNAAYFRDLIGRDILAALNSQRYRYFTNRRTDLLVSYRYFANRDEAKNNWNSYSGYKFAPGTGAQADLPQLASPAVAGSVIVIDVIDPKPRRLIWRGWATLSADYPNDRAAQNKLLKGAVNKILGALPKRG